MYMTTHTLGKYYTGLDTNPLASVARKNAWFRIPELRYLITANPCEQGYNLCR